MQKYSIDPCIQFDSLNKSLVEAEINFSRTVHFTAEIDLTEIERIRSTHNKEARPTYTAFIAKAIAKALLEFPNTNRRLYPIFGFPFVSFFQSFSGTDIAVAVERNIEGFNAVAYMEIIRDAHEKSLSEITDLLRTFSAADINSSAQWRSFHNLATRAPFGIGSFIAKLPWYFPKLWSKYRGGAAMISSPAKYGVDGVIAAWPQPLGFSFGLAQKKSDGQK